MLSLSTYIVRLNLVQRLQKYPRSPRSLGEAGAGSTMKQDSSSSLATHTLAKPFIQRNFALWISKQAVLKMGTSKNRVKTNQTKKQLILWPPCHFQNFILMHSSNFRNKLSPPAHALATKMIIIIFITIALRHSIHRQNPTMLGMLQCNQKTHVHNLHRFFNYLISIKTLHNY